MRCNVADIFYVKAKMLYVFDPKALHSVIVKDQYVYEESPLFVRYVSHFANSKLAPKHDLASTVFSSGMACCPLMVTSTVTRERFSTPVSNGTSLPRTFAN